MPKAKDLYRVVQKKVDPKTMMYLNINIIAFPKTKVESKELHICRTTVQY